MEILTGFIQILFIIFQGLRTNDVKIWITFTDRNFIYLLFERTRIIICICMHTHTEGQTCVVENLLTLFLFDQKGFASVSASSVNHKMAMILMQ
jgi:hypothetical protein